MPYSQDEYRSMLSEDTLQTPLLTKIDVNPTIDMSRPIRRLKAVTFDDDLVVPDCSEPRLILEFKLRAPKSEHMLQEEQEVPEPVPVVEEEFSWKPAEEMLLDLKAKSARLDAYVKEKKLLEEDLLQRTMKELKADPSLLNFMGGFSRLWKHVNQIPADGRPQDDIGVMDTSDIVQSGSTVKRIRLEKMMEESQLKWRKARKDSRAEMKKEGFEFKKAPARSTPSPVQMHHQTVPDSAVEEVEFVVPTAAAVVPVSSTEHYQSSDGGQYDVMSGYSGTVSPIFILVDESPSPVPRDPRLRAKEPQQKKEKAAPSEPEDIVQLYRNVPEAIITSAYQVNKEVPSVSNYHIVPNFDNIVSSELAAQARTIKDADNLPPPTGLLLKRGSNVPVQNEWIKRVRRCPAEVATGEKSSVTHSSRPPTPLIESQIRKLFGDYPVSDDSYSLVDEFSDGEEEEVVSRVITERGVPWKLLVVTGRPSATGNHMKHGLMPVDEDFWERRKTADPINYLEIETPVMLLDRLQKHPFYHLLGLDGKNLTVLKEYRPVAGLTIRDQLAFNIFSELHHTEKEYAKRQIIPHWGTVPVDAFVLPTKHPYDGLYWPLFQPIDNVPNNEDSLLNADVQNEMVNQTVCHYSSRHYFLCDDSPGSWQMNFNAAHLHYDSTDENRAHNQVRGRFTNRVGYARHIVKDLEQCEQNAKKAEDERQKKHQKDMAQQKAEQKRAFLERHQLREGDEIPGQFLVEYTDVCHSTSLNEQLRSAQRDVFSLINHYYGTTIGRRHRNPFPDYWFQVPREQYVPANDRRGFLCKYSNFFNEKVIAPMEEMDGRENNRFDEELVAEWVADACIAAYDYQHTHDFLRLTEADQKQAKARLDNIDESLPRNSVVHLDKLKELCALAKWEWKYWPLIWDTLSSVYRTLPPVSALMPLFEKPVDEAFQNVAKLERRLDYFMTYSRTKDAHLESQFLDRMQNVEE